MQGWISLHRKIQDNWTWQDKPFSKGQAWIDILLMANHEDGKVYFRGSVYDVKRGQRITSELQLTDRWGWSRNKVRRFLDDLKKEQQIDVEKDKRKIIITVVNYSIYQTNFTTNSITEGTINETSKGQQKDINNNDNNDNKKIYVLTQQQEQFIAALKTIKNYPVDIEKDLEMYNRLEERYPELNLLQAIEGWALYKLDKPLNNKSNPRSQINTSFANYVKWGKYLKAENTSKSDYEKTIEERKKKVGL